MNDSDWKIVYLTAGAGGMYCGSCMHDNTLVRELARRGVDVQLIPTYTPIRTDEESVAQERIFFGGVNVYLQHKLPWLRWIPGLARLLDRPGLLRWAASRGVKTNAHDLGALTVDMLRGSDGVLGNEVQKLCRWLADEVRPNLIVLSNVLIGGCIPAIKAATGATIVVTLQGDDVFLEELPEPYKTTALREIQRLVTYAEGFIVNSNYYADFMSGYLGIDRRRFRVVPLGIDTSSFERPGSRVRPTDRLPTVGYLARIAPEKGFHLLVDAFLLLRQMPQMSHARLRIAGWLGENNRQYADEQFARLGTAGLQDAFEYVGAVDRQTKVEFLESIDVFSVPTTYREPKGLFVLEALAAGVPVVQPNHGAFPELLADVGGGLLVAPHDAMSLAGKLHELLTDDVRRKELGEAARSQVFERRNARVMADKTLEAFGAIVGSRPYRGATV